MRIIYTCGDTNGIGPEIILKTLNALKHRQKKCKRIFIVPKNIFLTTQKNIKPEFPYEIVDTIENSSDDNSRVTVLTIPDAKYTLGKPTKESGNASMASLKAAYEIIKKYKNSALVTAPISKEAIKKGGFDYPGHTEMLASWSGAKDFVMMFLSKTMNGGLLTIHEPLKNVSHLLTVGFIQKKINVIVKTLQNDFAIKKPKIALLGLNPHAGENGNIGTEENEVFSKVITMNKTIIEGPFPADAFFGMKAYKNYDCVVAPYHDQLLIPFKLLSFDDGVNFTAGLPFIRTSPDHGTAYDIAGKGVASPKSMISASNAAHSLLLKKSKKHE